jgi:hypothetical protein
VVVLHCGEAIVNSGEFATEGVEFLGRVDPGIGRCGRIEDPARRFVLELVALGDGAGGGVDGREEEEDVAIGDGEVKYDFALWGFVAANSMALEC